MAPRRSALRLLAAAAALTSGAAACGAEYEFVRGTPGANACPEGSTRLSESECRAMPQHFGGALRSPFTVHSEILPQGCFTSGHEFIYNAHSTGLSAGNSTPYCKRCRDRAPDQEDADDCVPEYDCYNGLSSWQSSWSTWKKMWCCANQKLGCPIAAATTMASAFEAPQGATIILGSLEASPAAAADPLLRDDHAAPFSGAGALGGLWTLPLCPLAAAVMVAKATHRPRGCCTTTMASGDNLV